MKHLLVRNWNIFTIVVLLAGAAWIGASAVQGAASVPGTAVAAKGFPAPDFTLTSLDGTEVTLSELKGKAVLVNFWATWCPPCKAEMPAMQKMAEEYADQGFVVLAVNSTAQDSPTAVADFVEEHGLTFTVLLDTGDDAYRSYRVRSLPTTFFIDPDGIIQEVVVGGPMAEALLRVCIEALLNQ